MAWQPIYVLFFLHLETHRVTLAGITQHPAEEWIMQMARRAVDDVDGSLLQICFVLHDRDRKVCNRFATRATPIFGLDGDSCFASSLDGQGISTR